MLRYYYDFSRNLAQLSFNTASVAGFTNMDPVQYNAVPVNLLFYLFAWFHGVGSTAATDSDAGNLFQNQKKILFRMWEPQVCEALMMWNSITPNRAVNTTALKYLAV